MKELIREVTTKETYGWEAFDGMRFSTQEACQEYETSASAVVKKELQQYKIGDGYEDRLYDSAWGDCHVEIFDVKNSEVLHKLNVYLQMEANQNGSDIISDKYIGKEVVIHWNCDHDWCGWDTLDEMIKTMTEGYNEILFKNKEEQK